MVAVAIWTGHAVTACVASEFLKGTINVVGGKPSDGDATSRLQQNPDISHSNRVKETVLLCPAKDLPWAVKRERPTTPGKTIACGVLNGAFENGENVMLAPDEY